MFELFGQTQLKKKHAQKNPNIWNVTLVSGNYSAVSYLLLRILAHD